jgi:hypothetical protein
MIRYLEILLPVMPRLDPGIHLSRKLDCRVKPGNDEEREIRAGVLERHCAIGKTPLPALRLCNRLFACHNGSQPEYSFCTPLTVDCRLRTPHG